MNKAAFYVVATPIGNLEDITHRAVKILSTVDVIAAEDTRHSLSLLRHYGIQKPLLALHEHNENERAETVISHLSSGQSVALITDAGTPAISDPGYRVVKLVRAAGFDIVPIPGASAVVTALSVGGIMTQPFTFLGFLSTKKGERLEAISQIRQLGMTVVLFEAPHRILSLMTVLGSELGLEHEITLAKELTKTFEAVIQGSIADIHQWLSADEKRQQGEFVIIISPVKDNKALGEVTAVLAQLLSCYSTREAVDIVTKLTGERPNVIYNEALRLQKESGKG